MGTEHLVVAGKFHAGRLGKIYSAGTVKLAVSFEVDIR